MNQDLTPQTTPVTPQPVLNPVPPVQPVPTIPAPSVSSVPSTPPVVAPPVQSAPLPVPSTLTPQPAPPQTPVPTPKPAGKLKVIIFVVAILLIVAAGVGVYFFGGKELLFRNGNSDTTPPLTACTLEARICPDGSSVGRKGPNCEFAACPGETKESEVLPTQSPESKTIVPIQTVQISGSLQDLLKQKCILQTSQGPFNISVDDFGLQFDPTLLISDDSVEGKAICSSTVTNDKPIEGGFAALPMPVRQFVYVFDADSKELGHGGPPQIGEYGTVVEDLGAVKITAFFGGGGGPTTVGGLSVGLRGLKTFQTTTGEQFTVSIDSVGMQANDPQLISFLEPYGQESADFPGEKLIQITPDLEPKLVEQFFKSASPTSAEGKAIFQLKSKLEKITAKQ